jgi:hypothetical protein
VLLILLWATISAIFSLLNLSFSIIILLVSTFAGGGRVDTDGGLAAKVGFGMVYLLLSVCLIGSLGIFFLSIFQEQAI